MLLDLLYSRSSALKGAYLHLGPVAAPLLGILSGIGGGLVRDVLLSEVPTVFHSEIYAMAALASAFVVVGRHLLHLPAAPVAILGATFCFGCA